MRLTTRLAVAAAALLVAGCATGGTRTVDLSYGPTVRTSTSGTTAGPRTIALATFVDAREKTDRIGLTKAQSGDTVYVAKGGLPEAVTSAVEARLRAAGYTVTRLGAAWDPRNGAIPPANADLVLGGLVEQFYGETNGNVIWAPSDADVRLHVAVASSKENRLIGQSIIRSDVKGTTTSGSLPANLRDRFFATVEQVTLAPGLDTSLSGSK